MTALRTLIASGASKPELLARLKAQDVDTMTGTAQEWAVVARDAAIALIEQSIEMDDLKDMLEDEAHSAERWYQEFIELGDRFDPLNDEVTILRQDLDAATHEIAHLEDELALQADDRRNLVVKYHELEDKLAEAERKLADQGHVLHVPPGKSAIELQRGDAPDEGEGRIIKFMPIREVPDGSRMRFENGEHFEFIRRVDNDCEPSESFGNTPDQTTRLTVDWGGVGYFNPERIVQVDVTHKA